MSNVAKLPVKGKAMRYRSTTLSYDDLTIIYEVVNDERKRSGGRINKQRLTHEVRKRRPGLDDGLVENVAEYMVRYLNGRSTTLLVNTFIRWYHEQRPDAPAANVTPEFDFSGVKGVADLVAMLDIKFKQPVTDKQRATVREVLDAITTQLPAVIHAKAGVAVAVTLEVQ